MDKIDTIRREIEVMGQPIITQREGTGVTLNAFKRLSDDDVLKLLVTSKSTTCALDPLPSMIITKYVLVFLPILIYIIKGMCPKIPLCVICVHSYTNIL